MVFVEYMLACFLCIMSTLLVSKLLLNCSVPVPQLLFGLAIL